LTYDRFFIPGAVCWQTSWCHRGNANRILENHLSSPPPHVEEKLCACWCRTERPSSSIIANCIILRWIVDCSV
jgi:hypothetical protein